MDSGVDIVALLAPLLGPDPGSKRELLSDLVDLINRDLEGNRQDYHFFDPAIGELPIHLGPGLLDPIARHLGEVLDDPAEAAALRATAAFALGKTWAAGSLAAIVRAVTGPSILPAEVAIQAAFAFDALSEMAGPGADRVDLAAVEAGFRRLGIPWDEGRRRVAVNDL